MVQPLFSDDYATARRRFLQACDGRATALDGFTLEGRIGPAGEPLVTDIAWIGEPDAPRVFLSICGTHGQEFFAGSAAQLAWLRSDASRALPAGVAVCLVHAHNPFGAAYYSRANENHVDLNRNWFDPARPRPENLLYGDLHRILFRDSLSSEVLEEAVEGFFDWVAKRQKHELDAALNHGQQTHPDGIIFCGRDREWSTRTLSDYALSRLAGREKVALIDWHTGLGAFGEVLTLVEPSPGHDASRWAGLWWGVKPEDPGAARAEDPALVGYIRAGLAEALSKAGVVVASAVMEFGTYDTAAIMEALVIDRWLRHRAADADGSEAVLWRTRMMERLNPSVPQWRTAVIGHATRIYARTIRGLELWN